MPRRESVVHEGRKGSKAKHTPPKKGDASHHGSSAVDSASPLFVPDPVQQALAQRRAEIMARRRREENFFKMEFQLMSNAWDNLDQVGEDRKKAAAAALLEEDDKPDDDDEVKETPATVVPYQIIPDEKRLWMCGGLRQDEEECFSVTSWSGETMISKGKGKQAGQVIIEQPRRESDMHNKAMETSLDRETALWSSEESLLERREGAASVSSDVDDGVIYVIGGSNGSAGFLDSTERSKLLRDGRLKRWEVGPKMLTRRGNLAAVCLPDGEGSSQEIIYAIGGFSDGRTVLNTVEVCDLGSSVWAADRPLLSARACHAAAALGTRIFVAGGTDGERALASVEALDGREGSWRPQVPLNRPRCGLALAVLGGKLVAIGGRQYMDVIQEGEMRGLERVISRMQGSSKSVVTREFCDVVEVFDEHMGMWVDAGAKPFSAETAVDRAFAGVAVL